MATQRIEKTPTDRASVLRDLAEDALRTFEDVADTAGRLMGQRSSGAGSFASINELTATQAVENLSRVQGDLMAAYRRLRDEPVIARVVVADENDRRETIYVCRAAPVQCSVQLCSSLGPKGRLAALPVGDFASIRLPGGLVDLEVVEKSIFRPVYPSGRWDSKQTVFHAEGQAPLAISSLRELLLAAGVDEDELDALDRQLAEDDEAINVVEGLKRSVLTAMQLRDQPILDKFQDDIFRLPLDSRLVILGPPGTGKTTTLVRRLRQKIDFQFLEEDEQSSVEDSAAAGLPHSQSWLMFTPTELLKQYVREAFAREGVPAPEQRIRTWSDHRRDLARRALPILRSASGGTMVLNERAEALQSGTILDQIEWFEDFDEFQARAFIGQIAGYAETVAKSADEALARLGTRSTALLSSASNRPIAAITALSSLFDDLRSSAAAMSADIQQQLRRPLAKHAGADPLLLDDLSRFIATLSPDVDDDADEGDPDEEEEAPQQGRKAAQAAFLKALRVRAVAEARRRPVSKSSRNGRILQWLEERGLTLPSLADIGERVVIQRAARRLVAAPAVFVRGVPARYRAFRRDRTAAKLWYVEDAVAAGELTPLEVDVVLLALLRNARSMIGDASLQRRLGDRVPPILADVQRLLRNQILVDEATDFSPVQLACMAALCNLSTGSFFACGDFNQRLTVWGTRSIDHLKWLFSDLEVREIDIAYRQSRRLNEFAAALASSNSGVTRMPEHLENEGVPPVFGPSLATMPDLVDWLSTRIGEIEDFTGQLPSIAVLVNDPTMLAPLATDLGEALTSRNIRVVPCTDGQVMGQENDVRVFEVEHIKGLEFEAVFFIDLDKLEQQQPELFDKYVYVGATRAATYLGVTCSGPAIPSALAHVEPLFGRNW